MTTKKKVWRIEILLKKADRAIDEVIKRANEVLDDAVELTEKEFQEKKKKILARI